MCLIITSNTQLWISPQTKQTKSRQVHINKTAVKTGLKSSEEAAVFGVTLIKKKKKTVLNLYTPTLDIDWPFTHVGLNFQSDIDSWNFYQLISTNFGLLTQFLPTLNFLKSSQMFSTQLELWSLSVQVNTCHPLPRLLYHNLKCKQIYIMLKTEHENIWHSS